MALQFRRGTNSQRSAVTFASGEPVWTTDTNKLYVGDGVTPGGVEIAGGGGGGGGTSTYAILTVTNSLILTTSTEAKLYIDANATIGIARDITNTNIERECIQVKASSGAVFLDASSGVWIGARGGFSTLMVDKVEAVDSSAGFKITDQFEQAIGTFNTATTTINTDELNIQTFNGSPLAQFTSNGSTHNGNYHNFGNTNAQAQINSQGTGALLLAAGSDSNNSGYVLLSSGESGDVELYGPGTRQIAVFSTGTVTLTTRSDANTFTSTFGSTGTLTVPQLAATNTSTVALLTIGKNNSRVTLPGQTDYANAMLIANNNVSGPIIFSPRGASTNRSLMITRNADLVFHNGGQISSQSNGGIGISSMSTATVAVVSMSAGFQSIAARQVEGLRLSTYNGVDQWFTTMNTATGAWSFPSSISVATTATASDLVYNRTFGSFLNTATIIAAAADTAYILPINATTTASNMTLTNTGTITINKTDKFNIQFSLQLNNTANQEHDFNIWLRENGSDFPNSNTQFTLLKQAHSVAALNFLVDATAGDTYELMYAVDNTAVHIDGILPQASPYVRPGTPSVLLTVVPVGA